ncbi:MAG: Inositol 2-dehydrogenase [Pelotomaculum sp. PtaB.Bin104]|nr:MAG: Inositol 2-dehydrogenase [Pelotomaculum sp. PtaB.Bin104]
MDYLKQPLFFKIKKVLRYVLMYGIRRTYIKVIGQLHMRKKYDKLPSSNNKITRRQIVGIIGCGNYSFSNISYYLNSTYGKVIAACMDINIDRAASMASYYKIPFYTSNSKDIITNNHIELIYIASNHASHTDYAIEALTNGKNVYIEKPHVVSEEQLFKLINAMEKSVGKVFLGFNRPGSRFGKIIKEYLDKETGAGMYNWFVAGHAIDLDHWYFMPEEGGRVLGNLCHWTDFILNLVSQKKTYPIKIYPTRSGKSDCDIVVTYTFGDDTIAVVSFSAKGHTFEGVKEVFSAHKGNCLITMDNFKTMTIEVSDIKRCYYNLFRDHGHKKNILSAFKNVLKNLPYNHSEQMSYIWNTGWLFLKTKEALEQNKVIMIHSFEERNLDLGDYQT